MMLSTRKKTPAGQGRRRVLLGKMIFYILTVVVVPQVQLPPNQYTIYLKMYVFMAYGLPWWLRR